MLPLDKQLHTPREDLVSGRLLVKNTFWNLLGYSVPLLVAVFSIPPLIGGLGVDRFGLLTIAWAVLGYFSIFDLGIGRALTQLMSSMSGSPNDSDVPEMIWTSLAILLLIGLAGTLVTAMTSSFLVTSFFTVSTDLSRETMGAFYVLSASVPFITTTAGLRGILESKQRFFAVNALRIPMGIYTLLGPLVVLPFSRRLDIHVFSLLIGRILFLIAHFLICLRTVPEMTRRFAIKPLLAKPLLKFGAWMTVSNIVSPLMTNLDRLFIGIILSVSSVAYYAIPHEIATKLSFIPGAIVGVLFPAFALTFVQDQGRAALLYRRGIEYTFFSLFPLTFIMVVYSYEGLSVWLGQVFAINGQHVMQWLGIGIFINSLAYIPFALIQGSGRPDITGKLQLAELPLYLVAFWLLSRRFGIAGAAAAWTLRVTVEALFLFYFSKKLLPAITSNLYIPVVIAFLTLVSAMTIMSIMNLESFMLFKLSSTVIVLGLFAYYLWRQLSKTDRSTLFPIHYKH